MNDNPKIFAMYLPQYHSIPENDEFWGEGFTDWVTVKGAKPLFKEHQQPRIPLNNNYYDLSEEKNVHWQAQLAHDNGIFGFGVYHYWFNTDKNILTRPAEILRDSNNKLVHYFLSWDNANWKRSWSNIVGNAWAPTTDNKLGSQKGPEILIPYILGVEKDWRIHYEYVRTHFNSPNYEKYNNKPLFSIICYSLEIVEMCKSWNRWAKEDGFDGMCFIFQDVPASFNYKDCFLYNYEPHYVGWQNPLVGTNRRPFLIRAVVKLFSLIGINKFFRAYNNKMLKRVAYYDYDNIWNRLLKYISVNTQDNLIHGSFVGYDDSPRRGRFGSKIVKGSNPDKFKKYFGEFYQINKRQRKPYIFLTAWNEWGEGAYLEPDNINGMNFLKAIKDITS